MRKLLLGGTAALGLFAGIAQAEDLADPVMNPAVVEAKAPNSAGIVVPLLLLVLVAAALSGGGSDGARGGEVINISDRRVKTDCQWVGMTADALPVWRYRYLGTPQVFEGVMAQDVAMRRPDAAVTLANGLVAVNYSKLGLTLRQIA